MKIDYYVKQLDSYKKVLTRWRTYLENLQKQALSDKKSAIKIATLSDRKDLISCKELKDKNLLKELNVIHKLIDKEWNEYKKLSDDILKPSNVSLFSFKGSTVANKKKELKKRFNALFEYNEDQQIRVELLKKSMMLLKYENIEDIENGKIEPFKEKEDVKTKKTAIITTQKKEKEITEDQIVENTPSISDKNSVSDKNFEHTESTNEKPFEEADAFNYEEEIKKILGI